MPAASCSIIPTVLLRGWLREGLPDSQSRSGDAGKHLDAVSRRLPSGLLSAAAALPRAGAAFRPFNIDKPLWIFVGGRVTEDAGHGMHRTSSRSCCSLPVRGDRSGSIEHINRILNAGPRHRRRQESFRRALHLSEHLGLSAEQLYDETLATLFNAPGGGALHVENLKGATGEIALRVGDNDAIRRDQCRRRRQARQTV